MEITDTHNEAGEDRETNATPKRRLIIVLGVAGGLLLVAMGVGVGVGVYMVLRDGGDAKVKGTGSMAGGVTLGDDPTTEGDASSYVHPDPTGGESAYESGDFWGETSAVGGPIGGNENTSTLVFTDPSPYPYPDTYYIYQNGTDMGYEVLHGNENEDQDPYKDGDEYEGEYTDGEGNKGEYTYDEGNKGEYTGGEGNKGEYTYGEGNKGEYTDGEGNKGEYTYGEGNKGEYTYGEGNKGEYTYGEGNKGEYIYGEGNQNPGGNDYQGPGPDEEGEHAP